MAPSGDPKQDIILVVNGPNMNLLGTREPEKYGLTTLHDIETLCEATARSLGFRCEFVQSNHEGALVDAIHAARAGYTGIVINAAAFTHTSAALRDAIRGVDLPTVEVHLTNVHQREAFRHHSFISQVCDAVFVGAGVHGYKFAVEFLAQHRPTDRR